MCYSIAGSLDVKKCRRLMWQRCQTRYLKPDLKKKKKLSTFHPFAFRILDS